MASETAIYQKVILSDQAPTDESLSGHREIQVVVRSPSKVTERKLIDVASSLTRPARVNQGWTTLHVIVEPLDTAELPPLGEPTHTEGGAGRVDHPVAILPIACRRPSTLPLTFNPGHFGLLRGFLPTDMGEGRTPSPALPAVSAMCCCSWALYPVFPVRAYRRKRAVSQITDSGLCHSCYHIALGRIGTCQTKA